MNAPKFQGFTADFGNASLFNEPFGKKVWVIIFIDTSTKTKAVRTKPSSVTVQYFLCRSVATVALYACVSRIRCPFLGFRVLLWSICCDFTVHDIA